MDSSTSKVPKTCFFSSRNGRKGFKTSYACHLPADLTSLVVDQGAASIIKIVSPTMTPYLNYSTTKRSLFFSSLLVYIVSIHLSNINDTRTHKPPLQCLPLTDQSPPSYLHIRRPTPPPPLPFHHGFWIRRLHGGSSYQSKSTPPSFARATSFLCHLPSQLPMKSISTINGGGCGSGLIVLAHSVAIQHGGRSSLCAEPIAVALCLTLPHGILAKEGCQLLHS